MQRTHLPNGIVICYEPDNPDKLIVEYPDGEHAAVGQADRRRLARIAGQLREVYDAFLLRLDDDAFADVVPVDALLKFDEVLRELRGCASQRAMARR